MAQPKYIADYEAKMLEYGNALLEYRAIDEKCRNRPGGWPGNGTKLLKDLDAASSKLNRAEQKVKTAMQKVAMKMAQGAA